MKSLLWFSILAIFTPLAQAENFYSPILCKINETYLFVQNKSIEPRFFWFQSLGATPFAESHVEIKAQGNLILPLQEYYHANETAIAIKTQDNSLTFKAFCKSNQLTWNIEAANSPWKKISVSPQDSELRLHLANLSQQTNTLEISYKSQNNWTSQSVTLPEDFTSSFVDLKLPFGTTSVKVRGKGRWTGKAHNLNNRELFFKEETVVLASSPPTRFFLFESQDHNSRDSFVVPIENPKLIVETLNQIKHPDQARLLVARIQKSQKALNRDFSSDVKSPWSWQVLEAQNYADFAHISCDGTPALVEERLNSWLTETGGTICFWNYRVVRELTQHEVMQSQLPSRPGPESLQHKH